MKKHTPVCWHGGSLQLGGAPLARTTECHCCRPAPMIGVTLKETGLGSPQQRKRMLICLLNFDAAVAQVQTIGRLLHLLVDCVAVDPKLAEH